MQSDSGWISAWTAYRLDAIGTIYEDPALKPHDVPLDLAGLRRATELAQTPAQKKQAVKHWHDMFKNQWAQPGLHDLMKELRAILDEYEGDRLLVGEDDNIDYMGNGEDELHLVFNFPLIRVGRLTPSRIRLNQKERLTRLVGERAREIGWRLSIDSQPGRGTRVRIEEVPEGAE